MSETVGLTPIQVRWKFICHFKITNKHPVPNRTAFERVNMRFDETGGVTGKNKGQSPFVATEEAIHITRDYIAEHSTASIATAKRELGLSVRTTWFIRGQWWWQQNGAPVHATNACIEFLEEKFHG